jgi:hypothetical protein
MFVDVVRRHLDMLPKDAGGRLSGLRDPHVGAALALMHGRPADAWTLKRLAHDLALRVRRPLRAFHPGNAHALPDAMAYAVSVPPARAAGIRGGAGGRRGRLRVRGCFQSGVQKIRDIIIGVKQVPISEITGVRFVIRMPEEDRRAPGE